MSHMDYCHWDGFTYAGSTKCWYEPEEWKCAFHRAFLRDDPTEMMQALTESDDGRLPLGVEFVSSVKQDDGSWLFVLMAHPEASS